MAYEIAAIPMTLTALQGHPDIAFSNELVDWSLTALSTEFRSSRL